MYGTIRIALLIGLLTVSGGVTEARVVRVDIDRTEEVLAGQPFGLAGPYEKLIGTVHFAVDPANHFNEAVVDLDLVATDAAGQVTFSADLYVLRPKHPVKGNGSLFMEIANRGGKGMLSLLNGARGSLDPTRPEHFGDGFLMRQGFTLVWVGWQFDTRDEEGRLRLYPPRATGQTGLVRSDFIVPESATFQPLGHVIAGTIGGKEYPVTDEKDKQTVLTVRDRPDSERKKIGRSDWSFVHENGAITGIEHATGFEPGKIYELIYASADPALVGLGLVAVRDFASYAKHDERSVTPTERAIVFGISQAGRFLRHLLYQGFNADEAGRVAFDGVMSHVAGAGRGSFNHRFAQPSRDAQPMEAIFYPTDLYPFTDLPLPDPVSGRDAGLLDRAFQDDVAPRIFYSNTAYDYWGRAGSLIHTTPDGTVDAKLPDNVRIYMLAGLQHFSRPLPPSQMTIPHIRGRYVMNPNPSSWTMRALVVAMQNWIAEDRQPPASSYPRIDQGTLVSLETVKEKFPEIPGIELPRDLHQAYRMNYGPRWKTERIITRHPPQVGEPFTVRVPDVDGDGNDRGGIRIPQIEVPLATYTPWNLRDPSIGAPTERISFLGSYFPFPENEEAREATGDPRRSIAERYESFDHYRSHYTEAAMQLIQRGFLLPADLDAVITRGGEEWHYATRGIDSPRIMQPDELTRLESTRPEMRFAYGEPPFRFGELRLPKGTGPFPVAVLVHGGCWLAAYDGKHIGALAEALTREGIATWTLEYNRVGDPGGGWPGTFRDVADGTDYLRLLARDYPLDLQRVISIGHSAGGQLALWLAARQRLPAASPLYEEDPLPLKGVLGLAAAADLPYLHEQKVCGHVIDKLMGGSPDAFADRYRAGAPTLLVPLDLPQILLNGAHDSFWSSVARRYFDAAQAAGADVVWSEAPESGHFEMIDPHSTTWPLVREAVLQLIDDSSH